MTISGTTSWPIDDRVDVTWTLAVVYDCFIYKEFNTAELNYSVYLDVFNRKGIEIVLK